MKLELKTDIWNTTDPETWHKFHFRGIGLFSFGFHVMLIYYLAIKEYLAAILVGVLIYRYWMMKLSYRSWRKNVGYPWEHEVDEDE